MLNRSSVYICARHSSQLTPTTNSPEVLPAGQLVRPSPKVLNIIRVQRHERSSAAHLRTTMKFDKLNLGPKGEMFDSNNRGRRTTL